MYPGAAPSLPLQPDVSSSRPPKARTPPALPSPGRTSFPLSEWNSPRRTYRSPEDVPLVLAPVPAFDPPPAATRQPSDPTPPAAPQPPADVPPSVVTPETPPAVDLPPLAGDAIIVAPPCTTPSAAVPPPNEFKGLSAEDLWTSLIDPAAADRFMRCKRTSEESGRIGGRKEKEFVDPHLTTGKHPTI